MKILGRNFAISGKRIIELEALRKGERVRALK